MRVELILLVSKARVHHTLIYNVMIFISIHIGRGKFIQHQRSVSIMRLLQIQNGVHWRSGEMLHGLDILKERSIRLIREGRGIQ